VGCLLRSLPTKCLRARRRARGHRHDARGLHVCVLTGCCGEGVGSWAASALGVAYGGDPGGYRYLRLVARTPVCGALRPAVVVPGAVSRRARAHRRGVGVESRQIRDSREIYGRCAYASTHFTVHIASLTL
jgi:hypothetical protein